MTNPTSSDDDWNDLARELGVDKSKSSNPPQESAPPDMVERLIEAEAIEPHHGTDDRVEADAIAEGEPEAATDDDFSDSEEETAEATEATGEGGAPGTGRKRRRRRRRRRKGGATADGTAPAEAADAAEGEEDETAVASDEPVAEADDFDTRDSGVEEADGELVPLAVEEDTASDVLRDLIATWNVPSWEDIVSGLYRP